MTEEFIKKRTDGWVNMKNGQGVPGASQSKMQHVDDTENLTQRVADNLWRTDVYSGIAIDELVVEAMRKPYTIVSKGNEELTEQCTEWADDLGLTEILIEAWSMARAHGGAWLMLVTDEVEAHELHQPWSSDQLYNLQNIIIASREEVTPTGQWMDLPADRRFRCPKYYSVSLQSHSGRSHYAKVHHSRLIYIPGRRTSYLNRLKQNGYDDSVLLRIESVLQDKWSARRNMAELLYKAQVFFLRLGQRAQTRALTTNKGDGEDNNPVKERIKNVFHGMTLMGMPVLFEGEDVEQRIANFANLDKISDKFTEDIGAGLRMPLTRLQGQAPTGFNTDGSSQQANWHTVVASAQKNVLKPVLTQLWTAILCAQDGPTEGKPPKQWEIVFEPLDEPTETMKDDQRAKRKDILLAYLTAQVIDVDEVRAALADDEWLGKYLKQVEVTEPNEAPVELLEVDDASAA